MGINNMCATASVVSTVRMHHQSHLEYNCTVMDSWSPIKVYSHQHFSTKKL